MQYQQLPERTLRIIEHLREVWDRAEPIHPDDLKKVMEFVVTLPERYRQVGLATIAEYTTSVMGVHMLHLMALFRQNAEQEGISTEDVESTFKYVFPETFKTLSDSSKNIQVQSLEDVAALTNITINLQVLSSPNTAEDAQSWLYELPNMYYQQLLQEELIGNKQARMIPGEFQQSQKNADWISQSAQGYVYARM